MARKEKITKEDILAAAFQIAKRDGMQEVTARKLALEIGCSTQPIFRVFQGMEDVIAQLFSMITNFFEEYYENYTGNESIPFIRLGMAYISFAEKEKHLFYALFLTTERGGKTLYELLNGQKGLLVKEINKSKELGIHNPGDLFMKLWIFIHGAACMMITVDYELPEEETEMLLIESFQAYAKGNR